MLIDDRVLQITAITRHPDARTNGVVTISFGGNDSKTYWWTTAFLAAPAANLAFADWELSIARSAAASDAVSVRGSASQKPRSR